MSGTETAGARPGPELHHLRLAGGASLALRRFGGEGGGIPALLLHGAIENGRIFYSLSGKGLAPYLAARGFEVFVADFRGHGESRPRIGRGADYGQTGMITEEIPALVDYVSGLRPGRPLALAAHSWGGVLLNAAMARFPGLARKIGAAAYFGSKRLVRARTLEALLKVRLVWQGLCPPLAALAGYLPAAALRLGSDDDTRSFLLQCLRWVREEAWIDPEDGFDYGEAIRRVELPPTLYLAAADDRALGHPEDVRAFMRASSSPRSRFLLLSETGGNLHNYDHISMLTHPDAPRDHFPEVLRWLVAGVEGREGEAHGN